MPHNMVINPEHDDQNHRICETCGWEEWLEK